jgi:hypothetical protein
MIFIIDKGRIVQWLKHELLRKGKLMEIKQGMEVFLRGKNNGRLTENHKVLKGTLTKIGRQYYTVKAGYEYKFDKETLEEKSEYGVSFDLYFSEAAMNDAVEVEELTRKLRGAFNVVPRLSFTLDQLRRVNAILFEEGQEEQD